MQNTRQKKALFGYRRIDTKNSGLEWVRKNNPPKKTGRTPVKQYRLAQKKRSKKSEQSQEQWEQDFQQGDEDVVLDPRRQLVFTQSYNTQTTPPRLQDYKQSVTQTSGFKQLPKSLIISAQLSQSINPPKLIQINASIPQSKLKQLAKMRNIFRNRKIKKQRNKYNRLALQSQQIRNNLNLKAKKLSKQVKSSLQKSKQIERLKIQIKDLDAQITKLQKQGQQSRSKLLQKQKLQEALRLLKEIDVAKSSKLSYYIQQSQKMDGSSYFFQQKAQYLSQSMVDLKKQVQRLQQLRILQQKERIKEKEKLQIQLEMAYDQNDVLNAENELKLSQLREQIVLYKQKASQLENIYKQLLIQYQQKQQTISHQLEQLRKQSQYINELVDQKKSSQQRLQQLRQWFVSHQQQRDADYQRLQQQLNVLSNSHASQLQQLNNTLSRQKRMNNYALASARDKQEVFRKRQQLLNNQIDRLYEQKAKQAYQKQLLESTYKDDYNDLRTKGLAMLEKKQQQIRILNQQYVQYRINAQQQFTQIHQQINQALHRQKKLQQQLNTYQKRFQDQQQLYKTQLTAYQVQLMERTGIVQGKYNIAMNLLQQQLNFFIQRAKSLQRSLEQVRYAYSHKNSLLNERQNDIKKINFEFSQAQQRIRQLQRDIYTKQISSSHQKLYDYHYIPPSKQNNSFQTEPSRSLGFHNNDNITINPPLKITVAVQTQHIANKLRSRTIDMKVQSESIYAQQKLRIQQQRLQLHKTIGLLQKSIIQGQKELNKAVKQGKSLRLDHQRMSQDTKKRIDLLTQLAFNQKQLIKYNHAQQKASIQGQYKTRELQYIQTINSLNKQIRQIKQQKRQVLHQYAQTQMKQEDMDDSVIPIDQDLSMSMYSVNTLADDADMQYRQLQLGQQEVIEKQLGNQSLLLKKYKNRYWWGLAILNSRGQQYYTHQAVQFESKFLVDRIFREFDTLKRQFHGKKIVEAYKDGVMLIIDEYKGNRYVGVRHYNYYANDPQPTRYGFNLRWNQFEGFMRKTQSYLK